MIQDRLQKPSALVELVQRAVPHGGVEDLVRGSQDSHQGIAGDLAGLEENPTGVVRLVAVDGIQLALEADDLAKIFHKLHHARLELLKTTEACLSEVAQPLQDLAAHEELQVRGLQVEMLLQLRRAHRRVLHLRRQRHRCCQSVHSAGARPRLGFPLVHSQQERRHEVLVLALPDNLRFPARGVLQPRRDEYPRQRIPKSLEGCFQPVMGPLPAILICKQGAFSSSFMSCCHGVAQPRVGGGQLPGTRCKVLWRRGATPRPPQDQNRHEQQSCGRCDPQSPSLRWAQSSNEKSVPLVPRAALFRLVIIRRSCSPFWI
mmetsp:Transcript_18211/g.69032  ORF Transcript_18211/g.69032 Transcript_18211/m.69032 type:complete len:317 (-) Transcript_18211:727-1677(-)